MLYNEIYFKWIFIESFPIYYGTSPKIDYFNALLNFDWKTLLMAYSEGAGARLKYAEEDRTGY